MNLKKLIAISVLLPFLANGCATLPKSRLEPDIASELWNKIREITELKDAGSMPKISLLENDSSKELPENCSKYGNKKIKKQCKEYNEISRHSQTLARAFLLENRIEIYMEIISQDFFQLQHVHNRWLNENVKKVHFYELVAHEMLHHALWRKWLYENQREYEDALGHHRLMRDKKYLESALLYLCQKFNTDPKLIIDKLKMADLEYCIKSDNLKKERQKREKAL